MAAISTPVGSAPVIPVVLIGAGMYLAWFGVHYWGSDTRWPSDPVKAVLTGKPLPVPSGQTPAAGIAGQLAAGSPGAPGGPSDNVNAGPVTATGNAIADDAQKYAGQGYVWGGPADRPGNWDCSSFVSYVIGHDLGMALPGGGHYGDAGYPPHTHGPTTNNYLLYGTPVNLSQAGPGDIVVSTVHMGIVIGSGKMISAQDPQLGTGVAGYLTGFPGGTPSVRRLSVDPNAPNQGQANAGHGGGHP